MLEEPEVIMKRADEIARNVNKTATLQEIEAAKRKLLALTNSVRERRDAYISRYGEGGIGKIDHWLNSTGTYLCLVETDVLRKIQKPELERRGYRI